MFELLRLSYILKIGIFRMVILNIKIISLLTNVFSWFHIALLKLYGFKLWYNFSLLCFNEICKNVFRIYELILTESSRHLNVKKDLTRVYSLYKTITLKLF